jgi:hypothetical protein
MMANSDKPDVDVSEQQEPAASTSVGNTLEVPEDFDEQPVADVLEQAVPVNEYQIQRPAGSRDEAADADWIEQSIEVPVDEDDR